MFFSWGVEAEIFDLGAHFRRITNFLSRRRDKAHLFFKLFFKLFRLAALLWPHVLSILAATFGFAANFRKIF